MRTMYRVELEEYTDCEGRHTGWTQYDAYVETEAEARAIAQDTKKTYVLTGSWRIVERTIDEETFAVVDNTLTVFDYYKEVERYIYAEQEVERYTKYIEEVEASKVRCKTEKGLARKDEEIAMYQEWLEKAKATLAQKNK